MFFKKYNLGVDNAGFIVYNKDKKREKEIEPMFKNTYSIVTNFTYDADHKGAHYLINGRYHNTGEAIELMLKACKGYEARKDANTRFDKGSDIEETKTSIKTLGFSLCESIADNFTDTVSEYFKRTASTNVSYALIQNDEIVEYNMNLEEFKDMLERFGAWDKASKKIRVKRNPLAWLEMRAN